MNTTAELTVNGRSYRWMRDPLVVVCVDGCEYDYIEKAVAAGVAPFRKKMLEQGAAFEGDCVMPSFTNPNNLSIVTGDPREIADELITNENVDLINEAVALGARRCPGNIRDGALYSPTVVDRVDPEMPLVKQETFGPVSPIIRFRDLDDAIRISNSTAYGLSSSVCTNRMDYIARFVSELQVGTVNMREVPGYRLELTPFGGIKDSGLGYKEGVQEAIKSFTNVKTYSLPWA